MVRSIATPRAYARASEIRPAGPSFRRFSRVKSDGSMAVQGLRGIWLGHPPVTGLIRRSNFRTGVETPAEGEIAMKLISSTAIALVIGLSAAPAVAQYAPGAPNNSMSG